MRQNRISTCAAGQGVFFIYVGRKLNGLLFPGEGDICCPRRNSMLMGIKRRLVQLLRKASRKCVRVGAFRWQSIPQKTDRLGDQRNGHCNHSNSEEFPRGDLHLFAPQRNQPQNRGE